ncbi:dihydrolipoyl dehydrogenase, partial [Paraburkholderia sp. Tr-20389]|uniref:biotin/lipoyl-containing protein n=1 Tax=Paraburkholderia sp. Tr-20389 TaxID=2703903 RepID=UPI003216B012|nr:dihydrolipoyl dehydrogenase [Paraburkholderia sp. Tr-20389]
MSLVEVKVPDIGDFKDVDVIEVNIKPGDTIEKEQSLLTLESDKASMEVPSDTAGTVKEVRIKAGEKVSQGTVIAVVETSGEAKAAKEPEKAAPAPAAAPAASGGGVQEIKVPDIGDYKDVPVIEVAVKVGDRVEKEQSLVTLESDKATMDVPSPAAGVVKELKVKVGDNVSEGSVLLLLEGAD